MLIDTPLKISAVAFVIVMVSYTLDYIGIIQAIGVFLVASPRIELGSGASETLILSIVLRGHNFQELKPSVSSYPKHIQEPNWYYPRPNGVQPGGHCTTRLVASGSAQN